jgi:hypothetical protein
MSFGQASCKKEFIIPFVIFEDPKKQFYSELKQLIECERHLYRKSDWFFAQTPANVWKYLIYGSLYDPRSHKGIDKRFKCQQCAYAWWNYFGFLRKKTNKRVYDILQDEVAYSVLIDIKNNGEWGHGYWSDEIETHSRFHLDGIHLFLSQYEKTQDHIWLDAAKKSMAFFCDNLVEILNDGRIWFLHDTIEYTGKHHYNSAIFGKSSGNSLCLNTHIQALTVLYRLISLDSNGNDYKEMFDKGLDALQIALKHQPGELIYRFFIPWTIKIMSLPSRSTLFEKVLLKVLRFIIQKIYWVVQRKYPRLVYSNGFIERDLTVSCVSDNYHIINLKDLLTLYKQKSVNWLSPIIRKGVEWTRKLDLEKSLKRSPFFIEWIDVLYLYNELIEPVPMEEIKRVEEIIFNQTGGYSLDYFASELVKFEIK